MLGDWVQSVIEFFLQYGSWGLAAVSFMESSFSPIPPSALLILLGIAHPSWVLWYALITTVSSVAGGLFGWWIGHRFGRSILYRWFSPEKIATVEGYFKRYGGAALAIGGFSPLPYKVFTIASGLYNVRIREFIWWSILGRGARFFLEAILLLWLGQAAKEIINEYLGPITIVTLVVMALACVVYLFLSQSRVEKKNLDR